LNKLPTAGIFEQFDDGSKSAARNPVLITRWRLVTLLRE